MPTYAKYIRKMFEYKRLLMLTSEGHSLNNAPDNQSGAELLVADTVPDKGASYKFAYLYYSRLLGLSLP